MRRGFLLTLALAATASAEVGRAGAPLMRETFGARAFALGRAYGALADDAFGMSHNPATLMALEDSAVGAQFNRSFLDNRLGYLAVATPLGPREALGLSFLTFTAGTAELFDSLGRSAGTVDAQKDLLAQASYARGVKALGRELRAGVSAKLLRSALAESSKATGLAADLGLLADFCVARWCGFTAGLAAANLGPAIGFSGGIATGTEKDPLPLTFRYSLAYSTGAFKGDRLRLGLGLDHEAADRRLSGGAGVEYLYHGLFAARAGYRFGESNSGLSFGVGARFKDVSVDYALGLSDAFSNVHQMSAQYRFRVPFIEYRPVGAALTPVEVFAAEVRKAMAGRRYFDASAKVASMASLFPGSGEPAALRVRIALEVDAIRLGGERHPRYAYALGHRHFEEGRWDEAAAALEALLAVEPANEEVPPFLERARAEVRERLEREKLEREASRGALLELSNRAFESGDYAASRKLALEILTLGPYGPADSLLKRIEEALKPKPGAKPAPLPPPPPPPAPAEPETPAPPTPEARAAADRFYWEALQLYKKGELEASVGKLREGRDLDPTSERLRVTLEVAERQLRQKQGEPAP